MLRFLRRVTPLTWLIWLATVANLAAPGYLRFHLGFAIVDALPILDSIQVEMASHGD